jgi:hypothetical protein
VVAAADPQRGDARSALVSLCEGYWRSSLPLGRRVRQILFWWGQFKSAKLIAVEKWEYQPTLLNGAPVVVIYHD